MSSAARSATVPTAQIEAQELEHDRAIAALQAAAEAERAEALAEQPEAPAGYPATVRSVYLAAADSAA